VLKNVGQQAPDKKVVEELLQENYSLKKHLARRHLQVKSMQLKERTTPKRKSMDIT